MNPKLAIVESGGGLACSYSVGTVLALIEKFNLTKPDIVIGGSGSAGTMAYYISGQYDSIKNIWENLLCTKKFLNPYRFWKIIDIDYVIDQVFKKQDPLLVDKIYESSVNFFIPYTNIITGKVEYFSNRKKEDVFEALRATKAMPFAYGKAISINGQKFCDTTLSACSTLLMEKAKRLGAEKVLVLDNNTHDPVVEKGFKVWVSLRSKQFKKNYNIELNRLDKIHIDNSVFYLKPKRKLNISAFDNNYHSIKEAIDLGYKDTLNNKDLESFLDS